MEGGRPHVRRAGSRDGAVPVAGFPAEQEITAHTAVPWLPTYDTGEKDGRALFEAASLIMLMDQGSRRILLLQITR